MRRSLVLAMAIILLFANALQADDWPQWRGPYRSDVSGESGLLPSWPSEGPPHLWMFDNAGSGYSGFAIVGGRLFTMGTREGQAILLALDAETGEELWVRALGKRYKNGWGDGPRGTPTVDGDRVYGLTGRGRLACASVETGELLWHVTMKDFGGSAPKWGFSESVLIDGDQVICTPGGEDGAIVALNKMDGELLWQSFDLTDGAQYASIIPVDRNGQREYVQLFQETLAAVSATTGEVLWRSDWEGRVAVCPTPICMPDYVYISSGYGVGCKLVNISTAPDGQVEVSDVYANKVMKNHHGGVILVGEYLYGYSDRVGWVCQSLATGEEVWAEKEALGKGAIAYADGRLYCIDEDEGQVVLISASPEGWQEHGRFKLDPQTEIRSPRGRIWTHPVIANGRLYLRDQDLIYCYDVRGNASR